MVHSPTKRFHYVCFELQILIFPIKGLQGDIWEIQMMGILEFGFNNYAVVVGMHQLSTVVDGDGQQHFWWWKISNF